MKKEENATTFGVSAPFFDRVRAFVEKHDMVRKGERLIAAVSGGPDSVALLLVLRELGADLAAAHLNHGLRGEESDADEKFVCAMCRDLRVEVFAERQDARRFASERKLSLEDGCRRLRYAFLESARRAAGASRIATGHTKNDAAESLLLRLIRGAGMEGLSGLLPAVGGTIIRPLLGCTREEVEAYLRARDTSYRSDSSNLDLSFLRNRVRHSLLKDLQARYNPGIVETLARSSRIIQEESDYLEGLAEAAFAGLVAGARPRDAGICIDVSRLRALHPVIQKRCLRLVVKKLQGNVAGFSFRHFEALSALAHASGRRRELSLPRGLEAVLEQGVLSLGRRVAQGAAVPYRFELPVPGRRTIPEAGLEIECRLLPRASVGEPKSSGGIVHLNARLLGRALEVRNRLPGDRFRPFGSPGRKKLTDYFIDHKVPLDVRRKLPLLVSGDRILWVPGYQMDDAYRLTDSSEVVEARCTEVAR